MALWGHTFENNAISKPGRTFLGGILVPVNFLLFESPLGKRCSVGPQQHFCWYMDESEMARFGFQCVAINTIVKRNMEKCVVMSTVVIFWPSGELLVCWHQGRCNIVSKKVALSIDVK